MVLQTSGKKEWGESTISLLFFVGFFVYFYSNFWNEK